MSSQDPSAPAGKPVKRPRFTLVSAVYDVGRYLDEFIASIEKQTFDLSRVEVILVDDGSRDDSLQRARAWQERRPELVTVLTKPNGGQASARNLGLEHATGEWISFPDPDDVLDRKYLAEFDAFARETPTVQLMAANRITFSDATGEQTKHPLHVHFTKYNRLRDLTLDTGHFHGHASGSFFRLDVMRSEKLSFDERIRPSFEDGHLCCEYLLRVKPMVGYLATALYHYRKRDDGSSTLDLSWADARRFTDMIEYGYIGLFRDAADRNGGRVPAWVQGMVIYELSWYLKINDQMYAATTSDEAVMARFHELMTELCSYFDDAVLAGYNATRIKPYLRDILRHGYSDDDWHTPYAYMDKLDLKQKSMRVCYRFTGRMPSELFVVDGADVLPFHEKVRDIKFFDRPAVYERIVWLPYGTVRVVLDGADVDTRMVEPDGPQHFLDSWAIRLRMDPDVPKPAGKKKRNGRWSQAGAIRRLARTKPVRKLFGNAWVLMDRIINADDSAEHLFVWLRKNRPGVNAWFVVAKDTPDYARLRKAGYRRVIPHGSLAWKLLMLNAQHLISSHVDHPVIRPAAITSIAPPKWRFTFLQHGVIKDDISNWLNGKHIDVFVTSTPGEQESIAGDHTAYRYTTRESHETGLPRFDRILAAGQKFPPDRRKRILVAPTWRQWLIVHEQTDDAARNVNAQDFTQSEYAQQWTALLTSPELKDLADRSGLKIALLLHPNLQSALPLMDLPPYIEKLTFEDNVQDTFAGARVVITDYSSMAFNAAYIDRPLVYFQFDADKMFGGGHVGRKGYFEYARDGFGPVVTTADDAVAAIVKAVDHGPDPAPEYAQRIAEAFPRRDGKCCERTADAIAASVKPLEPVYRDGEDHAGSVVTPTHREPAGVGAMATDSPTPDDDTDQ